jgi:hypothetical protein
MVSIQDLFKYKKPVEIKDTRGEVVLTVWVRLLGDHDLGEAYRHGRIASAKTRKELRDTSSDEYFAEVAIIEDGKSEDLIELIKQSQQSELYTQAQSAIDRKDIPKIEDFAVDPDAPSLEEQEKRDMEELQNELDYQTKLQEYVKTRNDEIVQRLQTIEREQLVTEARKALSDLRALTTFIQEVTNQKSFRGTYTDKECKFRAFKDYDEYLNQSTSVKTQLDVAYQTLEISPDDLKN